MADTDSVEPVPEAVVWSERADAWSQRPAADPPRSWDPAAGRWSDVAATGRQVFPPEGLAWRSESAEWRSSTETARWRTTTEWRSQEGLSGWRSTTEAWQAGGDREGRWPADPSVRQPAISGTAWPTSTADEQPWSAPATPAPPWQAEQGLPRHAEQAPPRHAEQAPPRHAEQAPPRHAESAGGRLSPESSQRDASPSWQQPAEPARTWQTESPPTWQTESPPTWQTADAVPSWQATEPAAPPVPPWQSAADPTPSRPQETSWQPDIRPSWQQDSETSRSWQQSADSRPTWQRSQEPGWQQGTSRPPAESADTRPPWQPPLEPPTASWQHEARQIEPRPTWQTDADNGRGAPGSWDTGHGSWDTGHGSWDTGGGRDSTGWAAQAPVTGPHADAWSAPGTFDDGRHLVREDDRAQWRRESASGRRGDDGARRVGRRRAPEPDDTRGTGWTMPSDADNWAGHTDTGMMPLYQDPSPLEDTGWRREARPEPEGRRSRSAGRSREKSDSGSWTRDDGRTDTESWRTRAGQSETPSWRGSDSPEDADRWRHSREIEAASDPWTRGAADTGIGDMDWEPTSDTGGWRAPDDRQGRQTGQPDDGRPPRRAAAPRYDGEADRPGWPGRPDPTPQVRRQPAEPNAWHREQAARGSASYREGHAQDWRQEFAAQTDLPDSETVRFDTSDFQPFRPPGSPSGGTPRAAGSASVGPRSTLDPTDDRHSREELLVGTRSGGSGWQGPPDTQWPPQRHAGSYPSSAGVVAGPYERRPVGNVPAAAGRRNMLDEPDDEFEEVIGGPLAAVGYTALWYSIPVVLFVLYMLVLDSTQQSHALSTLAEAVPQFGLSLVLSMAVAVGLRRASGSWKTPSVGLAAAVMGGGLATVLMSAITGESLS